jgi:predicted CopG family antitoxin
MTTITISIDVYNTHEIVKSKKGFFTGLLAKLFVSEKKLKLEVEKKICEKIIEEMRANLNEGLTKEGVVAKIRYSYYQNQEEK